MMPKLIWSVAMAMAASGSSLADAQNASEWSGAQRVTIELSSFRFTPRVVVLRAGRPVILHLVNTGSGGHDFSAPEFFRRAAIRPADIGKIEGGSVDLGGHQSADIALVGAAGDYKVKCRHAFHSMFGMKGRILVQ